MSSRNQYDSNESRRSPRERSPASRYNDSRDEYRGGGPIRGNERRRPSIPDARTNHNSFAANRANFREAIGRESFREFPPRDIPRGPRGSIEPPTGPRSNFNSESRGDFGHRGDFRGRGRGVRGRGGWHDETRDRGRDLERDYRDRRDDRPERPRDLFDDRRDWDGRGREPFRGRRSPPIRGRSPNPGYGSTPRENRDRPLGPDLIDSRPSRDPSISAPSPSSDSPSTFQRGFGRGARGGRGRGRGYEDSYGLRRSRSPDFRARGPQRSATPPPQVPAFGSTNSHAPTSSNVPSVLTTTVPNQSSTVSSQPAPTPPTAPRAASNSVPAPSAATSTTLASPIPTAPRSLLQNPSLAVGPPSAPAALSNNVITESSSNIPIPTAPRAHVPSGPSSIRHPFARSNGKVTSLTWQKPKSTGLESRPQSDSTTPHNSSTEPLPMSKIPSNSTETEPIVEPLRLQQPQTSNDTAASQNVEKAVSRTQSRRRRPIIGRRPGRRPKTPPLHEMADDGSDSDSGDFDDDYFEKEIAKVEEQIKKLEATDPMGLRPQPPPLFVAPYQDSSISNLVQQYTSILDKKCEAPTLPKKLSPEPSQSLAPKAKGRGKSRPVSPLPDSNASTKPKDSKPTNPQIQRAKSPRVNGHHHPSIVVPAADVDKSRDVPDQVLGNLNSPKAITNGARLDAPSLEHPVVELSQEELDEVRSFMKTPPIGSLPVFENDGPWHSNERFVRDLEIRDPAVSERIRKKLRREKAITEQENSDEAQRWRERYLTYRTWTDFSEDPVAVRSRERFASSRAKAAAEAAAPPASALASAGAKPEVQRRGRFATEADFERVLQESAQEAKEQQEREDKAVRARTANAKEATIPAMVSKEDFAKSLFIDRTHIIPLERSFALLEFGEPIDNFTEEEIQIFEKVYIEHPKQWTKVAEALPKRDYKACIQHYYKTKHSSNLKEKLKKQSKKKRGRGAAKGPKPKSNALMADLRDDGEDGQDTENGNERRRPRRAAAPTWPIENPQSESEVASPAPTPGRKPLASAKADGNTDNPPVKRRGRKKDQDKGLAKQAKNNQLLAAAPASTLARQAESPAASTLPSDFKVNQQPPATTTRFAPQYDGANQRPFTSYNPAERPITSMPTLYEPVQPPFQAQERVESATPTNFESPDRRSAAQTSSYWSVPETTDFPVLLGHFGTDWHSIARFMTSKTHIMVYQSVFTWLTPSDSNKSRRLTNATKQVKNYYQRQVDAGKRDWEQLAVEADAKKARGEPTGPLPQAPVPPRRRYDVASSVPRAGSTADGQDDLTPAQTPLLSQASPPQALPIVPSARFPALAQAGPVPHQPASSTSTPSKNMTPQPIQQAPPQVLPAQRVPRGPPMGYFVTERPPLPAENLSQRSLQAAQEAQMERDNAMARLEREKNEQRQQQLQAMQRDRLLQLKQEHDPSNPHQYEPYSSAANPHASNVQRQRVEIAPPQNIAPDLRRTTQTPQVFQPRSHAVHNLLSNNNEGMSRDIKSSPAPSIPRGPMSAPPPHEPFSNPSQPLHHPQMPKQVQHSLSQPPQPQLAPARQQETVRKTSNLMALLNNDEPSDPRPPAKHVSDVSTASLHQRSHTPPMQQPIPQSHYPSHTSRSSISSQQTPQPHQMVAQIPAQQSQQATSNRLSYQQQPSHQHSGSMEQPRNFGVTLESRQYVPQQPKQQAQQQQQQQQIYPQQPRQPLGAHPPSAIRRDTPQNDVHGNNTGYPRTAVAQPSSMRMQDPPYAPSSQVHAQNARQMNASPHEVAKPAERDFYQRQQYLVQQQQPSAVSSPQLGPSSYHAVAQPQGHRHMGFGQSQAHAASPPTSYASNRPVHPSRQSSMDGGRYPLAAVTSAPTSTQHGYSPVSQHQPSHLSMQYQPQSHLERHEYEQQQQQQTQQQRQREQERRIEDYERGQQRRYPQDDPYQRRPDEHNRR